MWTTECKQKVLEMIKDGQVISGIDDCHVSGMTSLVFRERVDKYEGMWRVFFMREHGQMVYRANDGDWTLMPHNHRQDITLIHLAGNPKNVLFQIDYAGVEKSPTMWEYEFVSGLLTGVFGLKRRGNVKYSMDFARTITNSGIYLPAWDVHTVLAGPGDAWLVIEEEESDEPTRSYSRLADKKLDIGGLYNKLEGDKLQEACEALNKLIGEKV